MRVYVETIGILVLDHKLKERGTRKTTHFDSMPFAGIKRIIQELHYAGYNTEFVGLDNINKHKFNIYSIISSFEYINLLSHKDVLNKRTSKLVLGGAGLCNVMPLINVADIFHIGRGENCIVNIINRKEQDGTIYDAHNLKDNSVNIKMPECLIKVKGYNETSVGCGAKCFFCQYSWKNGTFNVGDNYTSGASNFEDYLTTLNWNSATRGAVSAIDGLEERTRLLVNKRIKNIDIINKFIEAMEVKYDKRLSLKLFNIVGYPWEKPEISITNELKSCFATAAKNGKYKNIVKVIINHNHFTPMPLTPMEMLPININNFRNIFMANKTVYDDGFINVWHYDYSASPLYAMEQAIINRATSDNDIGIKLLSAKKYSMLPAAQKIKILADNCQKHMSLQRDIPVPYIKRHINYRHLDYAS